jgi:hypothetical protein
VFSIYPNLFFQKKKNHYSPHHVMLRQKCFTTMNFFLCLIKHHSLIAYGAVKRRFSLNLISGACWRQVAIFTKRLFHDRGNMLLETLTRRKAQPKRQYRTFGKEKNVLLCWNQTRLLLRHTRIVLISTAFQICFTSAVPKLTVSIAQTSIISTV